MHGRRTLSIGSTAALAALALQFGAVRDADAHCDTMSGPVISAARAALESGDVNLVLIWVQPDDEPALRAEFDRALAARKTGGDARTAAEQRFFQELVRVHRSGEGAPYTGIKPAGTPVGPAVEAADRALAKGSVEPVRTVLVDAVAAGIDRHFREVSERRIYRPDDVAAGRAFVKAYVEFTHFAEGLYDKATAASVHHAETGGDAGHGAGHDGHGASAEDHSSHAGHLPWLLVAALGLAVVVETGWLASRRRKPAASPPDTTNGKP
jgi:hypothetical protein